MQLPKLHHVYNYHSPGPTCLYYLPPLAHPSNGIYYITPLAHLSNIIYYITPLAHPSNMIYYITSSAHPSKIIYYPSAHSSTVHIPHMGPPASIGNNIPPGPSVIVRDIVTFGPWSTGPYHMGYYARPFTCIIRRYVTAICDAELHTQFVVVPPGDEAKPISCPICKETLKKVGTYSLRVG